MKMKKALAAGLALAMAAGCMGGCGNTETQGEPTDTSKAASGGSGSAEGAQTTSGSNSKYNITWEDMAEIHMLLMCPGTVPSGIQDVEDAINEITETEINTHVSYEMVEIGNYVQQVSLKMSSSEPLDIVLTFPGGAASFASMQVQGQLMDITDLVDEYAPEAKALIGDYLAATTIDGAVYSLPIYRDVATNLYLCMRTDVLEDLGLLEKAQNLSSLREFGDILKAVKESDQWSYLSGIGAGGGTGSVLVNGSSFPGIDSFNDTVVYDALSDILVADPTGEDTEVKIMASTQPYKDAVALAHEWYQEGYVYKDSATEKEVTEQLVKSNKLFSYLASGEYGIEASKTQGCGTPMTCVKLASATITTGSCTKFTWAVPNTAQMPEAAVTFLNMMYTDPRINNLMAWGIEGRDYVVQDGVAMFPEGTTEVPYHGADFIVGNQFLTLPWDGQPADFREQSEAQMKQAPTSAYLGFTCNTDAIQTEIASLTSVVSQYSPQIISGAAEPEVLDEYLQKLQVNGIDKIITAYQEQLDAWLLANK